MRKLRLWALLAAPPRFVWVIVCVLCALSVTGAMLMLAFPPVGTAQTLLSYAVYALAAITFFYTVYGVIRYFPRWRRWMAAKLEARPLTRALKNDFGFRTLVFSVISLAVGVAYGVFNGVLGILEASVWYGALAAYHLLLVLLRGGILLHRARHTADPTADRRSYLRCGVLLLVLQAALSAAIAQMIFEDRGYSYAGEWLVIAVAAYAFYKIIAAVANFVKAKRQEDLMVQAVRNINLTDAAVSILALQTALLHAFGDGGVSTSHFNTATGLAVSFLTWGIGIAMIRKARKKQPQRPNGAEDGK